MIISVVVESVLLRPYCVVSPDVDVNVVPNCDCVSSLVVVDFGVVSMYTVVSLLVSIYTVVSSVDTSACVIIDVTSSNLKVDVGGCVVASVVTDPVPAICEVISSIVEVTCVIGVVPVNGPADVSGDI